MLAVVPAVAVSAASDAPEPGPTLNATVVVEGRFGQPAARSSGSLGLSSDGVTQSRNQVFSGIPVEASDPRLAGTASVVASSDSHSAANGDSITVFVENYEIVNDDGRWSGTLTGFQLPGRSADRSSSLVLAGGDGFDGLTALLSIDFGATTGPDGGFPFEGAIVIGEPPAVPSARSSE